MHVASEWNMLGLHSRVMEDKTKSWILELARHSNASFVLLGCHKTRIVKKGKAFNFQNSFSPFSSMVMNLGNDQSSASQVQVFEMRFLRRIE